MLAPSNHKSKSYACKAREKVREQMAAGFAFSLVGGKSTSNFEPIRLLNNPCIRKNSCCCCSDVFLSNL